MARTTTVAPTEGRDLLPYSLDEAHMALWQVVAGFVEMRGVSLEQVATYAAAIRDLAQAVEILEDLRLVAADEAADEATNTPPGGIAD